MKVNEWINRLLGLLRLTHEQEDHAIIHETIEKGIVFRGTNLWILVFAILIASVGLNMNSTAVVIGAMLISPLMGPINGLGYSVATYNFNLFRRALNNFGFAASAALVTSTLYFLLTPIQTEQAELLSRTSPTIYDVLIAMFGGLAGIVAISSKNKGNVIPGVAIATALMPPLCTAGYGLSVANWSYFLGALYLFFINSVFIALSAMLVSQILKLPRKSNLLSSQIKNKNILVGIVIVITVVPSFYLGFTLVKKEQFKNKAELFVSKVDFWQDNYLLDSSIDPESKVITLVYGGDEFDENSKKLLREKANDLNLEDAKIQIKHWSKTDSYRELAQSESQVDQMTLEISRLKTMLNHQQMSMDSLKNEPKLGESLLEEINSIFPQVIGCSYSKSLKYVDTLPQPIEVAQVSLELNDTLSMLDHVKVENWLRKRLKRDAIILHY